MNFEFANEMIKVGDIVTVKYEHEGPTGQCQVIEEHDHFWVLKHLKGKYTFTVHKRDFVEPKNTDLKVFEINGIDILRDSIDTEEDLAA